MQRPPLLESLELPSGESTHGEVRLLEMRTGVLYIPKVGSSGSFRQKPAALEMGDNDEERVAKSVKKTGEWSSGAEFTANFTNVVALSTSSSDDEWSLVDGQRPTAGRRPSAEPRQKLRLFIEKERRARRLAELRVEELEEAWRKYQETTASASQTT